jgi:hypothetical protein
MRKPPPEMIRLADLSSRDTVRKEALGGMLTTADFACSRD